MPRPSDPRAARWLAAADGIRRAVPPMVPEIDCARLDRATDAIRHHLGTHAFCRIKAETAVQVPSDPWTARFLKELLPWLWGAE